MQHVGKLSYGLYLYHFAVALGVAPWLNHELASLGAARWPLALALTVAMSYLLAALSFRYVEAARLVLERRLPRPIGVR
ncbi:MAG: hypothetical protein ABW321_35720 [Polyangiales bacterium]